jgi:hypothetical protein
MNVSAHAAGVRMDPALAHEAQAAERFEERHPGAAS